VITDVTPQESYSDAADYLRRLDDREKAIEARRWSAGETPGAVRSSHAAVNLRAAEDAVRYGDTSPGPAPQFGSQAAQGGLGGTQAIISQLAPKASPGSASRQARIRPTVQGLPNTLGTAATGPEARLAAAQEAYAKAIAQKRGEQFSYPEFEEPSWADRDWYDTIKKWDDRSDKVEIGDATPKIIK
jgi:hypothetical protein